MSQHENNFNQLISESIKALESNDHDIIIAQIRKLMLTLPDSITDRALAAFLASRPELE